MHAYTQGGWAHWQRVSTALENFGNLWKNSKFFFCSWQDSNPLVQRSNHWANSSPRGSWMNQGFGRGSCLLQGLHGRRIWHASAGHLGFCLFCKQQGEVSIHSFRSTLRTHFFYCSLWLSSHSSLFCNMYVRVCACIHVCVCVRVCVCVCVCAYLIMLLMVCGCETVCVFLSTPALWMCIFLHGSFLCTL